ATFALSNTADSRSRIAEQPTHLGKQSSDGHEWRTRTEVRSRDSQIRASDAPAWRLRSGFFS
ncbi:hypothetical protein, partial [Xanthomonas vasicola]|uniref:hypothetical protein n=1 Tax=Xanthomonas vasicola TaxID=56459 RepID=UPI001FEDD5DE